MKKGILFLLMATGYTANAQSLKDALYSGKLRMDSNSVIRKGDDLSSRIDTSTRKPVEPAKIKTVAMPGDSSVKRVTIQGDSVNVTTEVKDNSATTKNNNQVFKEFMDSLVSTLKTDVLPSKKIKNDTYYLYVDYEIGTDGQVNVTNVVSSPENEFLQEQVKERLTLIAPQLSPVLDSSNKPRKVKRKYNFNITKS